MTWFLWSTDPTDFDEKLLAILCQCQSARTLCSRNSSSHAFAPRYSFRDHGIRRLAIPEEPDSKKCNPRKHIWHCSSGIPQESSGILQNPAGFRWIQRDSAAIQRDSCGNPLGQCQLALAGCQLNCPGPIGDWPGQSGLGQSGFQTGSKTEKLDLGLE